MAITLNTELDNTGVFGDYFKIEAWNNHAISGSAVVTIQLYQSKAGREEGKNALNHSVQFHFTPGDHPISEFNVGTIDTTGVNDFRDLELHVRYQHIMNVAVIAKAIDDANVGLPEEEQTTLSGNEQKALLFVNGVRD